MSLPWRPDAPSNLVELAVGRCLIAKMDASKWLELGLITDTKETITGHERLLRALRWGDEDYEGHVFDLVPTVLGARAGTRSLPLARNLRARYPKLDEVAQHLDLDAWLASNEPDLYGRLFTSGHHVATPDRAVFAAAESAAARIDVAEMRRQVDRIRRDFSADPEAIVGQTKELIETVCKTILGMTGDADAVADLPSLVKRTLLHLGLDPTQVSGGVEAQSAKRLLGGVASILNGAGELRNARGTGHGRSGGGLIDGALARLTVGVVLPACIYLIEAWEDQIGTQQDSPSAADSAPKRGTVHDEGLIHDPRFGEGLIISTKSTLHGTVVTADFGPRIGVRDILYSD
ncbi:abortive infection family protein [uncultured Microbacterium sp.]|uniref:abortive infection family protein n=1 Tax=uncultured Microbacterium sp. TaxID=191216 RepID=UPI002612B5D5|nr:abortive infection family protein [uncultured Microbacterium sp.]